MRPCTICTHPAREEIDLALVEGRPLREIATRFGVTASAAGRHKREHLAATLAAAKRAEDGQRTARLAEQVQDREERAADHAAAVLAELDRTLGRVRKLFDACDRWLADPDDASRYDLGPRADEVIVHYVRQGPQGPVPAKAPLSVLLALAAGEGGGSLQIGQVQLKAADPRELLLKTARRLEAELQLVARLLGQIPEPSGQTTVNMLIASPEWIETRSAILAALEPYPDAHRAVAEALRQAAAGAAVEP